MSQTKVQLIAPIGVVTATTLETTGVLTATTFVGDIAGTVTGITSTTDNLDVGIVSATAFVGDFTGTASSIVTGSNVTAGIITGTKFVGNATGTVSGLSDDTNINVGIITSTSFVGDLTGNAAGLSTTTANLSLGIVTATSFAGNITGNAAGISVTTTNVTLGIITASAFHGSGANLSGVSAGPVGQQAVTANSGTTTIDLSSGNVIYMTQTADTTVSFASTEGNTDVVYLIRIPDGTARTLTWPSGFVWNGGSEPNLASVSSDFQVFKLTTRDNGATWYANISSEDSSLRSLFVWGYNEYGALGQNDRTAYSSPTQIPGNWTDGSSMGGENIAAGIKIDGTLWTWGYNGDNGQLGQNTSLPSHKSSPVQIPGTTWRKVRVAGYGMYATKTDNTLWTWGSNNHGQLGQNDRTKYSSPVQIPGTNWDDPVYHANSSVVVSKTDGTFWIWGYAFYGQLGLNTPGTNPGAGSVSSPTQLPGTTWGTDSTTWGGGMNSTLSIKTDGTLWAWGDNTHGQSGVNDRVNYSSPIQVPGTTWKSVSGGKYYFMAGTKTDGTLWAWGRGDDDMNLGLNDRVSRSSPTQIPGTTWNIVECGNNVAFATKTDGTAWAWGNSYQGQMGLNAPNIRYSSPVQLPGTWTNMLPNKTFYNQAGLKRVSLN